jgi:hypothetical protein
MMVSDLIERLRENPNYKYWLIMEEAAAEIERLEGLLSAHRTECLTIERLHGVLNQIAMWGCIAPEDQRATSDVARQALKESDNGD